MTVFFAILQSALDALQIPLDAATLAQLEQHWQLTAEYAQKFNLTAIRSEEEAACKHYADCLLLLGRLRELAQAARHSERELNAIDIGSGAGFPGLVLALACPHSEWLLLEANTKKCGFLELCIEQLRITNARVLPLRAEQAGHDQKLREKYQLVTARAVAQLSVLAEYALPLLAQGGLFAALKGPALAEEETAAANALAVLGARPAGKQQFILPGGDTRLIAYYEKTTPTPEKYPRRAGMPEKRPL